MIAWSNTKKTYGRDSRPRPTRFRAMLQGGNFGKTLVAVGEDPTLNAVLEARRAGDNVFG